MGVLWISILAVVLVYHGISRIIAEAKAEQISKSFKKLRQQMNNDTK